MSLVFLPNRQQLPADHRIETVIYTVYVNDGSLTVVDSQRKDGPEKAVSISHPKRKATNAEINEIGRHFFGSREFQTVHEYCPIYGMITHICGTKEPADAWRK